MDEKKNLTFILVELVIVFVVIFNLVDHALHSEQLLHVDEVAGNIYGIKLWVYPGWEEKN